MDLPELRDFLHQHLLNDIMPFWMTHSVDWERGGMFTCVDDSGQIISTDKYIWSNARALWTFSALYNRIEARDEWRRAAVNQYEFLRDYGRDEDGYWAYVVNQDGDLVQGNESIFVDTFALYGLVEYYRMTKDDGALQMAIETAESCRQRLAKPGSYRTAPYPTPPGMKAHREAMQFSLMFGELGEVADSQEWLDEGMFYTEEVMNHYYREDRQQLYEYVRLDNECVDSPEGRTVVPGHAVESLWFQIVNLIRVGRDADAKRAAAAIQPCLEKGWDEEYGGLFLGIDAEGKEPVHWKHADMKLWWPMTEALCGTLLAYEQLGEQWCLDWYWRCHDWSFAHFPVAEHGEWTQKLNRQGKKHDVLVALPVKDPFHLPRALIIAIECLDRIQAKQA